MINTNTGKKRKTISPIKEHALNDEKNETADCVFDNLVEVMSGYLEKFKDNLVKQMDKALQSKYDDLQLALNVQTEELEMMAKELEATKEQQVITEGRLTRAEKLVEDLREQLLQQEARSMRDNLVFFNVPEQQTDHIKNTEHVLRDFLKTEMKIKDDDLRKINFDRVHRTGAKQQGRSRLIVAKFNPSYGKEIVLKHAKNLRPGENFGVNEQLPRELDERKKQLLQRYKDAKNSQQKPKWSMDKLVVGNTVTKVERDYIRDINTPTTTLAATTRVKRSPPNTHNKNTFQSHMASVDSQDKIIPALHAIYKDNRVARATHNTYAYRIQGGGGGAQVIEHYEDDGDYGAGRKLLQLLQDKNITNQLVCVSRWAGGGTFLGPSRFQHITAAANRVLGMAD